MVGPRLLRCPRCGEPLEVSYLQVGQLDVAAQVVLSDEERWEGVCVAEGCDWAFSDPELQAAGHFVRAVEAHATKELIAPADVREHLGSAEWLGHGQASPL